MGRVGSNLDCWYVPTGAHGCLSAEVLCFRKLGVFYTVGRLMADGEDRVTLNMKI